MSQRRRLGPLGEPGVGREGERARYGHVLEARERRVGALALEWGGPLLEGAGCGGGLAAAG